MNVPVRNLVFRRNKYYFRCRFPQCRMSYDVSAIQRYGYGHEKDNPSEIKISLRTSDLKTAVSMCKVMTERFENLVSTGSIYGMTLSEIRKILTAEISRLLEDHARQLADYGEMCATTRREGMEKALSMMKFFERQRDNGCPEGKIAAAQLLKDIPHSESDINFMAREWTLAQIFIMRMQHDCIAGKRALTEYRDAIYDEVMNGDYRSSDEIRLAEQVYTLRALIERFLTEKAPLWGVSLLKLTTADLHTLTEYFSPEEDIKAIRHQNMLDYRDNILLKLPPGRNTNPKYQNIPLRELAAQNNGETLAVKTVNLMLSRINSFFLWCVRHEYISHNPVENLKLRLTGKANEERLPFTTEELQVLFTNLRADRLPAWKPHKLWIPLIALYSGARMNEICQLQIDNIVNIGGVPCMEITDETDEHGSIKNESSKRIIPIHPTLVRLGLLGYVQKRRACKSRENNRLWFSLVFKPGYGYGHDYSKSVGNFKKRYVSDDERKVFHSFRHNFTDNLKQQGIQESMIAELVGHSVKSVTFGRYGKDYNPSIMLESLAKLDYGFDMCKLLGITPLDDKSIAEQIKSLPCR